MNISSRHVLHGDSSRKCSGKRRDYRLDVDGIVFGSPICPEAILTFLETTDVGRRATEEVWENGSERSLEEDGDVVDMGDEEESMEVEVERVGGGGV